jgi:spermidine/putrescine ABC transporter ATP-binding subunit/MGT family glycosyltransferase
LTAVDAVDVSIKPGEFYALLGPSGCGKTTLLRCFAGFERPDEGRILLDGDDITDVRPNRRPLCMMFQSYALFPHMTVAGNIAYGLEMERLPQAEVDKRSREILEITGLSALRDRKPHQLSGGQRQRVALARALVKKPRVLLLDEPLSALDKALREQMQVELKRIQKEAGIAFVIVTHDQEEALGLADRIAVLDRGRVQQIGGPREVYNRPINAFVAGFVGENNLIPLSAEAVGDRLGGELSDAGRLALLIDEVDGALGRRSDVQGAENHHAAVESAYILAIRPERIQLARTTTELGEQALPVTVRETVFHGSDMKLILTRKSGATLIARLAAARADALQPRPGDQLWCAFDLEHSRLITAESGWTKAQRTRPRQERTDAMADKKVIAFFPEAAFGPALNSVAIAQATEKLGHKAVFLSDPGFTQVYRDYGFEAHDVNLSEPMPPEQMAKYWVDFINGHIPNFNKAPIDQIENYVKDCWNAIVETSIWAEKDLPGVLAKVRPDVVCVDNVILFPAIKRYAKENGKPWVRIISCSENEIPDPDIPPHLSGCGENDKAGFHAFDERFNAAVKPAHDRFNEHLIACGEAPYPLGQFFETSPFMNLLLYPEPVKFKRRNPLDPRRFQYLDGCVRQDKPYTVPTFQANNDKPLIYVSFGSLGAGDTATIKRLVAALGKMPVRVLINVGDYLSEYQPFPSNVIADKWFPQPSVIPQAEAVIHHGGNNSFTECLYFGKPAIIMPYVWDGHDNATRVEETGHGLKMHRADWTEDELWRNLERILTDREMMARLSATSAYMKSRHGPTKAAGILSGLLEGRAI